MICVKGNMNSYKMSKAVRKIHINIGNKYPHYKSNQVWAIAYAIYNKKYNHR